MRYGVIGTGWIVESFIQGAAQTGGMELTAVCSRDAQRGQAFAERCCPGSPVTVYTDAAALAASGDIDSVYIASPNALHYVQSKLFLEQGKHVLCEKPITVTKAQLEKLIELADSRGCVYMEAIMLRHLPALGILHDAVMRLGHITSAHLDFSQLSSKYPALLAGQLPNIFNPALATGCLMDLGVYCVYAALELFGKPQSMSTSATFLPSGADSCGSSVWLYDDKQVTLTYSKIGQSRLGSEILGDQGTLVVDSISKLTDMKLFINGSQNPDGQRLNGDVPKATLMAGEAADFCRYASQPAAFAQEIREHLHMSLAVCEAMQTMRRQAGIVFEDDKK